MPVRSTSTGTTLAAVALVGGLHLGRPGERVLEATAGPTRITTTVTPVDGRLRLRARVAGVDAGERCTLVATDSRGRRAVAGGWVAARRGDTDLAGAAVDPDEPAAVGVVTAEGRTLVTATA
ncbi:hypothetical protein AB0I60_24460 [Actinosynnema sp. NPDC050436]|uniref:hypothetical protein n=1 Tax=Actinosynnema sp. NPDC050436 TaxID=3155659 RepID=UPI0033FD3379